MNNPELYHRLVNDLRKINMPVDEVELVLRPYSSIYMGRYYPSKQEDIVKPRIFIYPCLTKSGILFPYSVIFSTLVHEMVHHVQYTSSTFVRIKGIMHNEHFWILYNRYIERAERSGIIEKEKRETKKKLVTSSGSK